MMTRADFFDLLERKLRDAPEVDRIQLTQQYEEIFDRAIANGEREEDIVQRILYPHAEREARGEGVSGQADGASPLRVLAAGAGLFLFNLIFVLAPFIAICALLFSVGLAGVCLLLTPILYMIFTGLPSEMMELLFTAFALGAIFGLGLLLTVLTSYAGPLFAKLTRMYVSWNLKLVRGNA